jgi:preprotein translocase subunit SecE
MARDRKRAKQRRQRQQAVPARPAERLGHTPPPDPLDHASADVDIARASEVGAEPPSNGEVDEGLETYAPDELEEPGAEAPSADPTGPRRGQAADPDEPVGTLARPARRAARVPAAEARERPAPRDRSRFMAFLVACWAELQRVQWPDRRHVAQATGVVLGFVIIAGMFLGLMDALWSRVVDVII